MLSAAPCSWISKHASKRWRRSFVRGLASPLKRLEGSQADRETQRQPLVHYQRIVGAARMLSQKTASTKHEKHKAEEQHNGPAAGILFGTPCFLVPAKTDLGTQEHRTIAADQVVA